MVLLNHECIREDGEQKSHSSVWSSTSYLWASLGQKVWGKVHQGKHIWEICAPILCTYMGGNVCADKLVGVIELHRSTVYEQHLAPNPTLGSPDLALSQNFVQSKRWIVQNLGSNPRLVASVRPLLSWLQACSRVISICVESLMLPSQH